jgi:pimeloyl-ACP methyl ester carboxylesterase
VARRLDLALGILNGALGDHLARTRNGLAIEMAWFQDGLAIEPAQLGGTRVVVFVHGLMANEAIWRFPDGSDYGTMLARDLSLSPAYLRYNTGLSIVDNGHRLATLLRELTEQRPSPSSPIGELVLVGHSMGGLVLRAACHAAYEEKLPWLNLVRRAFYVGTPHLGSPVERVGRVVAKILQNIPDPYTQLIGEIADARSAGIKDLGNGAHPIPLLPQIEHHVIAASLWESPQLAMLFGDLLVPVESATSGLVTDVARMSLPQERVHVLRGIGHNALAHSSIVYELLRASLS